VIHSTTPSLLEVGRIGKAHGLGGHVLVTLVTDRVAERTAPGTILIAEGRSLKVGSARPHKDRWLVSFVGVINRNEAEQLSGKVLEAEPLVGEDTVFVHEVIGRNLIDQNGVDHGQIQAVIGNPASDLMELSDGRLVPFVFLVSNDETTVHVSVPAGLLDDVDGVEDAGTGGGASGPNVI